jgi:DNA-directed RNA polymerase subunit RPC12/RpoP
VSQASFPWEKGESPIVAAKVKDLNNDLEGILVLTSNRFIFENEKEITLKKVLFVVTEKKTVREVVVQKPIGMVSKLVHGKVGFFRGSGLFVEFAPESGIPEMKLDSSGQDAEWIVESYNYIISGQADEELASVTPAATDQEKMQLAVCPNCSAPYREKIYRGQTSVSCKYCGATIAIQQRG